MGIVLEKLDDEGVNVFRAQLRGQIHPQHGHAKLQAGDMVFEEHHFVVADADGFEERIAIPESAVTEGNGGLVNAYEVAIQYAVYIL
jgi:hypothetical protein